MNYPQDLSQRTKLQLSKKKQQCNPLQRGIRDFVTTYLPASLLTEAGLPETPEALLTALPKRFTIYMPMLLLSSNALTSPPSWGALYAALTGSQREALYVSIVKAFEGTGVTHIAINAPIASTDAYGLENRMRSPTGLVPLYGDFGPLPPATEEGGGNSAQIDKAEFDRAFWVRTTQNHGIVQIWAPVYTMFSRGNVTEKARILGHASRFDGFDEEGLKGERVQEISVVDMYAGIGYFVFSYLKRGVKRIWGFELNGWSVEGMRRGCEANGWECKVIRVGSDGTLDRTVEELVESLSDSVRVVVFHGDNQYAAGILDEVKQLMECQMAWNNIRHVNLGLLPSSRPAWDNACRMVDSRKGGWIHVHENVGVHEIDQKKGDIVAVTGRLWRRAQGDRVTVDHAAECRHVEQVKTYAPGVMHCVFDIELLPPGNGA